MDPGEKQVNLHTHTPLCRHATTSIPDFCRAALEHGFRVLGFSDHAPLPHGRKLNDRMDHAEIPLYLRQIEEARAAFPDLILLKGWELDFVPDMDEYIRMYREETRSDFLLGSAHRVEYAGKEIFFLSREPFDAPVMEEFLKASVSMIRSGVADAVAHPDAAAGNYSGPFTPSFRSIVRDMAQLARERNVPLEINANGIRGRQIPDGSGGNRWRYPWRPFWEVVAEEGAPVIVSADAHAAERLFDDAIKAAYDFADELSLNVVNSRFAESLIQKTKTEV